jgi:hypothetical protein
MGLPRDFDIGEKGRGRVMRASILPAFFLANQLVALVLDLYYSDGELFIFFDDSAPEIWQRLRRLISSIQDMQVLALAGLFVAGLSDGTAQREAGHLLSPFVCRGRLRLSESAPQYFSWQRMTSTPGVSLAFPGGKVSALPADHSRSAISSSRTEASDRLRGEGLHDGSVASRLSQPPQRWTGQVNQSSA